MCGIAGIFAYDRASPGVDRDELLRVREAMTKRGPDGAGTWISPDGSVGLAHRRLAIIDLSDSGAQPMATPDGQVHVILNGEIYNYRALRRELEGKGVRFRSSSDTEVLLHLYAERGAELVHALRGMYAFALWDERRRGLLLARDPFGIKPLYYADDGKTLRVASQVKALLKGGAIDTAPEPAGHVGFFLWGHVPEPYTLYRGIRALPAGSSLWIDAHGRRQEKRFFNVTDELAKASEAGRAVPREEMRESMRAALLDSVRHHLIADVPVGVFLSSGLDSATITALAAEIGGSALKTLTLGFREFQGTPKDEVPLAELLAAHYGTHHQTRWVRQEEFQAQYPRLLEAMDQPSTDGVNSYFISKAAAEAGLKVALSGLGGDELFGGYPSFRQLPRMVGALRAFEPVKRLGKGFRYLSDPILKRFTSPKYAGLLEYGGTYGGAYLLRRGMFMPWELPGLLDGEMVRQGWQELHTLSRLRATVQGVKGTHLKVAALETAWYMRNQLLRDTDWASMAHSLEVRVPLVDVELFRAVAPLLASPGVPGKQAMAGVPVKPLPEQIMRRQKTGFTIPSAEWLTPARMKSRARRGLRGWAATVYQECRGEETALSAGPRPIALIFRTGQLGDAMVAFPAIELIRHNFPGHRFILLTDRQRAGTGYVSSWDVFGSTGWFERVIFYEPGTLGWATIGGWTSLLLELRALKVDQLFNLAADRSKWQAARDRWFLGFMAGARNYHAPAPDRTPTPDAKRALPWVEPEWRHILRHFSAGEPVEPAVRVPIPEPERERALRVARTEGIDFGAPLLAFGPGSKMPAKMWAAERYAELGVRIRGEYPGLQFVVLGGREDAVIGQGLCGAWGGKAHNLAGKLSLYGSAAILEKCVAYVGNDTGTMHLAAACGIRCVAIFSARDYPGRWEPYGKGHVMLRREVECAGCLLEVCEKFGNKCLQLIGVDEVHRATRKILADAVSRESAGWV